MTVETPPVPGTTDQVDVNFNVTEKSTGNVSLGVGYSQVENVMLSASISQANIFGSGKFASLQVSTGKINRVFSVGYTNPYFTVDGISQGFDLYHKRSEPDKLKLGYSYATESTGGGVRFGIPIGEKESLNFGAAVDYTDVTVDMQFRIRLCNTNVSTKHIAMARIVARMPPCHSRHPGSAMARTVAITPTKGAFQKLAFEISPLGDLKYYKATYQHQRFFAIAKKSDPDAQW